MLRDDEKGDRGAVASVRMPHEPQAVRADRGPEVPPKRDSGSGLGLRIRVYIDKFRVSI